MKTRLRAALAVCATRNDWEHGLRQVMLPGLVCLIAGMAVLPTNNHVYERVFLLTFFLPGLLLVALRPSSVQVLWRQPTARWVMLLLAWSALSLFWSDGGHASDWVGRDLGILMFLYGWIQVFSGREQYIHRLLFCCSIVMALAAITLAVLAEMTVFHSQLVYRGGRLMGFGALDHPTLAATAMSAATIWLCTYPCGRIWQHVVRALLVIVLLAFVVMTFSRSVWAGVYLALLVIAACREGRGARWVVASLVLLGGVALLLFMPDFTNRGWSSRPEILAHDWALFLQHPWLGVGQATAVHLHMGTWIAYHAHNLFAQLAVQLGLPGLLIWLGIWVAVGWQGWLRRRTPLGRLVLASWVYTTFVGQFDLPYLIDSPDVEWLVAWLPLAIIYSLRSEKWFVRGECVR